ncbi:unnamed protein product, partial [marine sediment metagenome]
DVIVLIYLSILPALAIIIGGSSSANPLGAIGASREMKLILADELPFIMAIFTPLVKIGSLKVGSIITYQLNHGIMVSVAGNGFKNFQYWLPIFPDPHPESIVSNEMSG